MFQKLFEFLKPSQKNAQSQDVSGNNSNAIAGNQINYSFVGPDLDLNERFALIDSEIESLFGSPRSPTEEGMKVKFSSGKLFSSLIDIGIDAQISYLIAKGIKPYLEEELAKFENEFDTSHIRRAVGLAILHMEKISLSRTARRNLAGKYARTYGDPRNAIMVIFEGNQAAQPLNFRYLERTFLPDLTEKLVGFQMDKQVDSRRIPVLPRASIDHMTNEILGSVRRMGIYQVRYETLWRIAEDLALQPPHPWFVNNSNKEQTIQHDMERAESHFKRLDIESNRDLIFWRSAGECLNHICSCILANYNCAIGGGKDAAPNTMRNFTRLACSETHSNLSLWDYCEINQLDDDLQSLGRTINDFHRDLIDVQKNITRMNAQSKMASKRSIRSFISLMKDITKIRTNSVI